MEGAWCRRGEFSLGALWLRTRNNQKHERLFSGHLCEEVLILLRQLLQQSFPENKGCYSLVCAVVHLTV